MDALASGLEQLGMVTLLRQHPNRLAELFTHTVSPLTAGRFVSLMRPCSLPDMPLDQVQAYKWFLEYLKARETCKLSVTKRMTFVH